MDESQLSMKKILFGTNNLNKLEEIRAIVPEGYEVVSLQDIGLDMEVEETELTLEGNAWLKAEAYFMASGIPCFADDTGLEVAALNGEPGVFSARWAGDTCSYQDNVDKMLREMDGQEDRNAAFRTVIAWADGGPPKFFDGVAPGTITEEVRGIGGFGYDPVFLPEGKSETFAEMSPTDKHAISHRGKAVRLFIEFLQQQVNAN